MFGKRVLNRPAAIELCWYYLQNEQAPLGIRLLSKYDTWCNEDAYEWKTEILPFQFGMRLTNWLNLLNEARADTKALQRVVDKFFNFCHDNTEEVMDNGNTILDYQKTQNEMASQSTFLTKLACCFVLTARLSSGPSASTVRITIQRSTCQQSPRRRVVVVTRKPVDLKLRISPTCSEILSLPSPMPCSKSDHKYLCSPSTGRSLKTGSGKGIQRKSIEKPPPRQRRISRRNT
jgi:hypothetical protein